MVNKRQRKKQIKKQTNNYQFAVGEKTLETYRREVRNTRAKLNRILKQHNIDLSDEIPTPDLESFRSRKEFNEWTRKVQSFRNRANRNYQFVQNEYGVSASKARLDRIERQTKKAQQLADEQINALKNQPFVSGGVQQGTVGMQRPNKTGISRPSDFDFSQVRSIQRLKEIEENVGRKSDPDYYDERNKRMQDNFIDMLKKSFNSDADELIEIIKGIHPDDFYQMYLMIDEFDFVIYYVDEYTVELNKEIIDGMITEIRRFENGEYSTDMWHPNFNRS